MGVNFYKNIKIWLFQKVEKYSELSCSGWENDKILSEIGKAQKNWTMTWLLASLSKNKKVWCWMDGWTSRFKDCLQQQKIVH